MAVLSCLGIFRNLIFHNFSNPHHFAVFMIINQSGIWCKWTYWWWNDISLPQLRILSITSMSWLVPQPFNSSLRTMWNSQLLKHANLADLPHSPSNTDPSSLAAELNESRQWESSPDMRFYTHLGVIKLSTINTPPALTLSCQLKGSWRTWERGNLAGNLVAWGYWLYHMWSQCETISYSNGVNSKHEQTFWILQSNTFGTRGR